MIKIIGVGASRTGTLSLKFALEHLGFDPAYHFSEMILHPEHTSDWLAARFDKQRVTVPLSGYRASLDYPANQFWPAQARAFPNAVFILTTRDPDDWYHSIKRTLLSEEFLQCMAASPIAPLLMQLGMFGSRLHDEGKAIAGYRRYLDKIHAMIPPDRLLEFHIAEGWRPLCSFLECEEPSVAFPHINESSAYLWRPTGKSEPMTFAGLQQHLRRLFAAERQRLNSPARRSAG